LLTSSRAAMTQQVELEALNGEPVSGLRPGDAGQAVKGGADQAAGCSRP
jgi:hypothetical protein